jgi:hypothetical protein
VNHLNRLCSKNDDDVVASASIREEQRSSLNMVRKGQMRGVEKGDSIGQVTFFASLFGVAA